MKVKPFPGGRIIGEPQYEKVTPLQAVLQYYFGIILLDVVLTRDLHDAPAPCDYIKLDLSAAE